MKITFDFTFLEIPAIWLALKSMDDELALDCKYHLEKLSSEDEQKLWNYRFAEWMLRKKIERYIDGLLNEISENDQSI